MRLHEAIDHAKSGGAIARWSWRDSLAVTTYRGKTSPQQRWLVWLDPRKLLLVTEDMTACGPIAEPALYEVFIDQGSANWRLYTISADDVVADDWGIFPAKARQPEESR